MPPPENLPIVQIDIVSDVVCPGALSGFDSLTWRCSNRVSLPGFAGIRSS